MQISFLVFVLGVLVLSARAATMVNITQHHNNSSRDGLYIDPALTQAAAANLQRDLAFDGTIDGHVYAQPLYLDDGPGGRPTVFVVTESDNVYALDAGTGAVIWHRQVGTPMPLSGMPCGNIDPLGITGTPVIHVSSRQMFFDAMTTPDGGATARHLIFALDVDTGKIKSGWPVDVNARVSFAGHTFNSKVQNQRGALAVVGGNVYVPYGGLAADCGDFRGWLVGVPVNNPANVTVWAAGAQGGGSWAPGGVASDGTHPFIATGNTFGASTWSGGEAIIRFQSGPVFSGTTSDYWSPLNWQTLDAQDIDIGGSGPLLVDLPGVTPSKLVISLGKDGNAYVLDRGNLGGVSAPLAQAHVSSFPIIQAAAAYRTAQGTYIVFKGDQLISLVLGPAKPPTITRAWATALNGRGSPFVTSTDGTHDVIVWVVGSEGDQRLHGFDGDTGAEIFSGGGANEQMTGTRRFNTGIVAHGRIYFAGDNKVYAFSAPPAEPIVRQITGLTNALWDFSVLTNDFQSIELDAEKIMDGGTNFIHAAFAAPYAQDGRGKLAGAGSTSVVWSSNVIDARTNAFDATYVSKGSVTSSKGLVHLVLSVKVSGLAFLGDDKHPAAQRSVILNLNCNAKFDPQSNQMSGRRSDTASVRGLVSLSDRQVLAGAFPPELGDGSWTLVLQFGVIDGKKSSGTATVTLSTGRVYPFTFTGTFTPRTEQWKLKLKGVNDGKGSNLQVIAQGGEITRIVGRVSGQSVNVKE